MFRSASWLFIAVTSTACASAPVVKDDGVPATTSDAASAVEAPLVQASAAAAEAPPAPAVAKNVKFADIPFAPFDPKKPEGIHVYAISGDPKAGPFSAIVRMPAGYQTPLHTHKANFSGVALSEGLVHSATTEPGAPLPKGSIWYQPGGEAHLDGCKSEESCYLLVFFDGAVDMTPVEAPAAEPKMQLTRADEIKWVEVKGGVKMAVIHGNPKEGAFQALFDFPAGMTTNVHTHSAAFAGALVSGIHHRGPNADALVSLSEGSVWSEPAESPHMEKCGDAANCILAAAMDGPLDTTAVELTPATK